MVDFETHFVENGGKVLWARNADDALTMIFDLIAKEKANAITRSNSNVLDEIELNGFLERLVADGELSKKSVSGVRSALISYMNDAKDQHNDIMSQTASVKTKVVSPAVAFHPSL